MLQQQSLLMRMEQAEEEDLQAILQYQTEQKKKEQRETEEKKYWGKGNAKAGQKAKYMLYPPSDVFDRVKSKLVVNVVNVV